MTAPDGVGGWLRPTARVGSAGRALLHLLLAVVAARIALGGGDGDGAFGTLAGGLDGRLLLGLLAVALATYGAFRLLRAVRTDPDDDRDLPAALRRVVDGGRGATHVGLAWLAAGTAVRGHESDSNRSITADLLATTPGRVLVVAVGVGMVVGGVVLLRRGVRGEAADHLDRDDDAAHGATLERLRTVGFVGRGVAYGITGLFVVAAAVARDADAGGGLDAALQELQQRTYGPVVLVLVSLGYLAQALYSVALARWHTG